MPFTIKYPKKIVFNYRYKNNFKVKLLLFTKHCHVKNIYIYSEDACDGAYSVNSLNDFELLDLGSASLSITRYLLIDKNNTLSIFMLSGSIQFSIPFQFNTNHAFVKIMHLYNVCVM